MGMETSAIPNDDMLGFGIFCAYQLSHYTRKISANASRVIHSSNASI